jgi:hypothetical protein
MNELTLMLRALEISVAERRRRDSSPRLPRCSRVIQTGKGPNLDQVEIRLDPFTKEVKVDGLLEPIPISADPVPCTAVVVEVVTIPVVTKIMAIWLLFPTTATRPFQSTL